MAMHSNILAWEIPQSENPGGLPSLGLGRVGPNSATKHTHTHIPYNEDSVPRALNGLCDLKLRTILSGRFDLYFHS